MDELINIFNGYTKTSTLPTDNITNESDLNNITKLRLSQYAMISTRMEKTNYVN